jgi:hypothetical protein
MGFSQGKGVVKILYKITSGYGIKVGETQMNFMFRAGSHLQGILKLKRFPET